MSAYEINKFLHLLHVDDEVVRLFRSDPDRALTLVPLAPEEAAALREGRIEELVARGAHYFLLYGFARHNLLGLDRASYLRRVRNAERSKATGGPP